MHSLRLFVNNNSYNSHKAVESAVIMPPKTSKLAKAKQKPQEDQREESLQAVVSVCLPK